MTRTSTRHNKRGFSLGEILVAIAITAVIAAVVIPSIAGQLKAGDEGRVQQDLTAIRSGIEQFLADVRRYPASVGQLVRKPGIVAPDASLDLLLYTTPQVNRWRGPYISKDSVSAVKSGFDVTITNIFTNTAQPPGTQQFLTIEIATIDTANARRVDQRMDDGVGTTGMIQWGTAAATTTLKYFALPVQ